MWEAFTENFAGEWELQGKELRVGFVGNVCWDWLAFVERGRPENDTGYSSHNEEGVKGSKCKIRWIGEERG